MIPCSAALVSAEAVCRSTDTASFRAHRPAAAHQLAQILPGDIFLGDVVQSLGAADFVNLHDIGMHQCRGGLGFHVEAADIGVVFRQLALEHLERDLPAQRLLLGQIDIGHAAAAQPAQQPIVADLPAGQIEIQPAGAGLACFAHEF